jgi:nucleoside-diphosphate-sugar epimerase
MLFIGKSLIMIVLIIGASGATGKLLVEQLLSVGLKVKIIVRSTSHIPDSWESNDNITIIRLNSITDISANEMTKHLNDCQWVVLCLGHNPNLRGIYGKPKKLVTDFVELICNSIINSNREKPLRIILMNTTGNSNKDLKETVSFGEKIVKNIIRLLLPPFSDNEKAAEYLRLKIGKNNPFIEWVTVRPDNLIDIEIVTEYSIHISPTRSALFNPGQTSRINVAHFMFQLITNDIIWDRWKGEMPVIYNEIMPEKHS